MKRRSIYDQFDPFDPTDEDIEEMEEFSAIDLDVEICYGDDAPICLFGIGDSDGKCIRGRYGCHISGCDLSDELTF